MKVVSLSVKNLRCLKNIVNMPLHGLTILIGENDAGKSTVLDAIDMALNKRPPVPDDYYVCNGGTPEQEIVIELLLDCSQDSKRPDQKYLARDGLLHYRVIHTPGAVRTEVLGKRFVNPALNQDYTRLGAGPFDELLESLGIRPEGRLNNDVRLRLIQDYLTSANPETTYDWIEIRNELNEFLPRFERFSTSEYRNPEALIQRTLTSVVEAYLYETDEATDTKSLIKPLQEVRDELKARLDARISELLAFVQVYNPGVTSLWIEPVVDFAKGFQTGRLFLGGQYGIYHMGNKGEGTK
ncbi:MAG: AAA family ATPase, partial [Bacteroidota bacterium]